MRQQEKVRHGLSLGILALLLALILPAAAETPAKSELLAEVDGEAITADEVEKAIGAPLKKLEEQIYNLKRQKLGALITERLLAGEAAKRGVPVQALLDAEVTAKAEPVSEQEIDTAYQALKGQLKGDEASGREQIRARLPGEKLAARRVSGTRLEPLLHRKARGGAARQRRLRSVCARLIGTDRILLLEPELPHR
jgi:hypothetical protein